jgi:hypothetical protein
MPILSITNANECFKMGLITRAAFQKYSTTAPFANLAAVKAQSNWDALIAAVDDTKIQLTPLFAEFSIVPTENIMYGSAGGNETPKGNQILINDKLPQNVTMQFLNLDPDAEKALYDFLQGYDSTGACVEYGVWFFDRNGNVIYDGSLGTIIPFKVDMTSISFGSQGAENLATTPSKNSLTFTVESAGDYPTRWTQDREVVKLDFSALNTATFNN